jgi:melibiose permease
MEQQTETKPQVSLKGELRTKDFAAYGAAAFGTNLVYMLTATFTVKYYETYFGADKGIIGSIMMAAMVLDALNDPLSGMIVAKVNNTKWGKFRPWIFFGTLVNAAILFALFAMPEAFYGNQVAMGIWCGVFYILWSTTYDAFDIPFWSMVPALTSSGPEREKLTKVGRTLAGIGCAIVSALTLIIVPVLGGGVKDSSGQYPYQAFRSGFLVYGAIIAVIFIATSSFLVFTIKEKHSVEAEKPVSVKEMFRALFANSQAMAVVVSISSFNLGLYVTNVLSQYFFQFDVGGDYGTNYMIFSAAVFIAQVFGMTLIYSLLRKKYTNKSIFLWGVGSCMFGYLSMLIMALLNMTTVWPLLMPAVFIGIGNGILNIVTTVCLADSIDYGELQSGHREESVVCSMQTFVVKIASGVAYGITLYLLQGIGFDTTEGAVNTHENLIIVRVVMTVLPLVMAVFAGLFFLKRYFLTDAKMKEITAQLSLKRAQKTQVPAPETAAK